MDLLPTDDQSEITRTVAAILADSFPMTERDRLDGAEPTVDDATWHRFGDLGWFSLGLPEDRGGVGYGPPEEALLGEELGRQAAPGGFLPQIIAAHLAAGTGLDDAGALASGRMRAAWAEAGPNGTIALHTPGAAWTVLSTDGSLGLVPTESLGPLHPLAAVDPPTPIARVETPVDAMPATPAAVGTPEDSLRAGLLVTAQLAGVADGTTAMSVEYAKQRLQFGQPIGSFQAVKHRCADMASRADAAINQSRWASLALADGLESAAFELAAARIVAARSALENAETNVQNHGGIGFTWEHPAHRYVTRARLLVALGGDGPHHRSALLDEPAPAG